jgi:hypothetical protein
LASNNAVAADASSPSASKAAASSIRQVTAQDTFNAVASNMPTTDNG